MRATLEYYKALYDDAMTTEVLSWDDASNNRCLCPAIAPGSTTPSAPMRRLAPRTCRSITTFPSPLPAGPAGRYWGIGGGMLGIWNFSKQIDLARNFWPTYWGGELQGLDRRP